MKVKELINALTDMPMEATVQIVIDVNGADICSHSAYDDKTLAIVEVEQRAMRCPEIQGELVNICGFAENDLRHEVFCFDNDKT